MNSFERAQEHESDWWGNCANMFGEELKQIIYARGMHLDFIERNGIPYQIDLKGAKVLDIGGGPQSLLLKAFNGERAVVDPCDYPDWVAQRYAAAGIDYVKAKGEDLGVPDGTQKIDEVWIYNVLQHTEDPEKIIKNARRMANVIRIFEWIDHGTNEMHPHNLTEEKLNTWLGGKGKTDVLDGINGCYGKAYYSKFSYV